MIMRSILLCDTPDQISHVYAPETLAQLTQTAGLEETVYTKSSLLAQEKDFSDVDYIFSTWGMPLLSEEEIRYIFPKLQCVFYAAGSVQSFARPFLNCGIKVFSAWGANAVPVAEYTTAQIILANKGFFATAPLMSSEKVQQAHARRTGFPGNFGETVGIIGAGMIGKLVIRMLKNYNLRVMVYDPFLPDETVRQLDVDKCSLEALFRSCQVISNHLANNPQTTGMLNYPLFASMRPNATFINTGRGAQVVEDDLVKVLTQRPDLTAVLDVTFPEPPLAGHPFYQLPNCIITPHIAGSSGDEVHRMAEYMAEEFRLHTEGLPCRYEVTAKMLETMA